MVGGSAVDGVMVLVELVLVSVIVLVLALVMAPVSAVVMRG